MIYASSVAGFLAPFIIPAIVQLSGSNPYHIVLTDSMVSVLPRNAYLCLNILLVLLGVATLFILIFEITRLGSQLNSYCVLGFVILSRHLTLCLGGKIGLVRSLKLYRQLFMIMDRWCFEFKLNLFLFYIVVSLAFTICCNFIVLRIRLLMPTSMWILFTSLTVPTYLVIIGITPLLCKLGEETGEGLKRWEVPAPRRGTLFRKIVKSLKPVVLHGGFRGNTMICFNKAMKSGYYRAILDNTILASISINV